MKLPEYFKKIKIYIVLYTAGIFLMLIPLSSPGMDNTYTKKEFNTEIENKIENVIKDTYSLSDVNVLITYDTYGEKIHVYEYEQSVSETEKTYHKKLINNRGGDQPYIKSEKLPEVRGVLVSVVNISESVQYDIRYAVATLLGVSVNKVNVICGKE